MGCVSSLLTPQPSELLTTSLVTAAHECDPSLPAGDTSYNPYTATYLAQYDNSKSKRILGFEYIDIKQATIDMLEQVKEKGWYP